MKALLDMEQPDIRNKPRYCEDQLALNVPCHAKSTGKQGHLVHEVLHDTKDLGKKISFDSFDRTSQKS